MKEKIEALLLLHENTLLTDKRLKELVEKILIEFGLAKNDEITVKRLKAILLPASFKDEDGEDVPFVTKEQYDMVIDYLLSVGTIKE